MTKEMRIKELIERYQSAKSNTKHNSADPISCISRDIMRKVGKIFEKEMHEPIDKYLK